MIYQPQVTKVKKRLYTDYATMPIGQVWLLMSTNTANNVQPVSSQSYLHPLELHLPIGKPWEMIAVDVLQVPMSFNDNQYLLVVQDYFTKWADAFPMPDQTAKRITSELIGLCSRMGLPSIVHSDQGRNFESTILKQTLDAFGVTKSHTTAYHPDVAFIRSTRSRLGALSSSSDVCLPYHSSFIH